MWLRRYKVHMGKARKDSARTDIAIIGGGIAGLIAALAFAKSGHQIAVVEPNAPRARPKDLRSTAFLQPARHLMEVADIWSGLRTHATPLQVMALLDAGGEENEIRFEARFDAAEISNDPFGWNFPNHKLVEILGQAVIDQPNITTYFGQSLASLTTRQTEALVRLDGGGQLRAQLVIGADGRESKTRDLLGIDTQTTRYGQRALAFAVCHERAHENTSCEIHRSGGPFTTVPLPDVEGRHRSAIVWMEKTARAEALFSLPDDAFNAELNTRSCGVLGRMELTTSRGIWPIIARRARALIGQRTALIAEAAHVIPPIGAQGLNMSLADIQTLLDLADSHPLGSAEMLAAFARKRRTAIDLRMGGIDLLNRAAMTDAQTLRDLRLRGLQTLYQTAPVKTALMKEGLGL